MENNRKPILILGSNGKTGSRVVQKLEALQIPIRKGSRNAEIKFDWNDQQNWVNVLQGIKSVYISFQPDLAVEGATDTINAFVKRAKDSGVEQLVLLSGRGEPEAQQCEQIVMESGLRWTVVRASWFNQNFSESYLLDPVVAGYVELPIGDVKEPFIDADDIADVAVAALTENHHDGKLYEVTGPRLLSFKDAVNEIAIATGRSIQYNQISVKEYVAQLEEYQVPEDVIGLLTYLFTEVLDGRNESISHGVEVALGRPAKDFSAFVKDIVARGLWNGEPE